MTVPEDMTKALQAALERRPEIDLHAFPLELAVEDGVLVMSGEVEHIAAKRVARLEAVRLLGADRVLDHLRVLPAERRGDAAIADTLYQALMEERAFRDYAKSVRSGAETREEAAGGPVPRSGAIEASVEDGVVTLEGAVGSLMHKRLADILAWWTPGVCEVEDRLHVEPDERDTDAEIADALRMVLEKDPWLDATQVAVQVEERSVTLEGLVASEEQRRMATQDAWAVLGVRGVDNRLAVQVPGASSP